MKSETRSKGNNDMQGNKNYNDWKVNIAAQQNSIRLPVSRGRVT